MGKYRFGEFELDLDAVQLLHNGTPVRLERRPLDLLILLLERPGRLVGREEIIARLWPPRVVIDFDAGLNTLVRKLRNALGDTADNPRFVETVPGRGYRFVAEVTPPDEPSEVSVPGKRWGRFRWQVAPVMALIVIVALTAVLAAAALLVGWLFGSDGSSATRLAVLPFENLSGNPELDYLAYGLAEDTSTSLSQIDLPDLRIIGYTSARAIATHSGQTVQRIGRELDVDFLVLSSLRLDEPRIRVTTRLVRVDDAEQIWSASFDRMLTNPLGLQKELSVAIAEQIRLRLSPDVAAAIDRRQTQNPRAYELYLKGRDRWHQTTQASVRESIELYQQATVEDPDYALAWAGLAHAASTSLMVADGDPRMMRPLARDALAQALRLDPDLAETQYAESYFHLFIERDPTAAEPAARRAVALDPNSAIATMLLGIVQMNLDNIAEAEVLLKRARELDPLFDLMWANSANVALRTDLQAALDYARQAIAVRPDSWVGYFHLGNALRMLGDTAGALAAYTESVRYSGYNSKPTAARAYLLIQLGREDEARNLLAEMSAIAARRYYPPYAFAVVHAGLAEIDLAFEALNRAIEDGDVHLFDLLEDVRLESLRRDPRFEVLVSSLPIDRMLLRRISPASNFNG